MMDDVVRKVFSLLTKVMQSDEIALMKLIDVSEDIYFDNNAFMFTLPALYQLFLASVDQNEQLDAQITYTAFRGKLYASNINAQLRMKGLSVEVFKPTTGPVSGKVDANYYQLSHLS